ncbi:class I SAM-dependent methyltransferase [Mycolicibacterium smegmatis]|uniref:Methyltransferase type 11 n=2 Tax=Mycolicibacterium smegmatis TaxID=1772 RepID=I7GDY6_MYCS2|nr:class I SAM-dependent methyltransferase [Mycolicibacterium smegmatis]AFP41651.1 Methyltransferase type 11 [Mycolicibacterium smegmatis MC2 155]MCC3333794.1 methyltransferase domain-containing protein [Mycolicibacterium smegmatis]MCO4192305.1 methyltransferase domain-containing protein [Mycolicibacterium smegmatis]MCP2624805.1 methyltransferase domain-containing protein [Mycolicibacterium smegmatis]MDF1898311.1 methyltransferase domain-containing protein [Mycolicibacterium smegmatis]
MLVQPIVTLNNDYAFGAEERERLVAIESLWDAGSQALLAEVGLSAGWNCLELGAGGGSLVEWMVEQGATVTAIDLDTRFVEHLRSDTVTVVESDIRRTELPQAAFDLVHARLVLEHLVDRRQVFDRLIAALRPGGWLVVEDFNWSTFAFEGFDGDEVVNAVEACLTLMRRSGVEVNYGRRMVADLVDAGFVAVRGEGRVRIVDSTAPGFAFFKHSLESLSDDIVAAGLISAEQVEFVRRRLEQDARLTTPMMVAALGRRP